jgi:hypothetical protein
MQARFIGDPRHDFEGPPALKLYDRTFVKDAWTDISGLDTAQCAKLVGNTHFQTGEAPSPLYVAPALTAEEIASIKPGEFMIVSGGGAGGAVVLDPYIERAVSEPEAVIEVTHAKAEAPTLTPAQVKALDRDDDGNAGGSKSKAALVEELKALGASYDHRWGVPKLERALEQAKFIKGDDD